MQDKKILRALGNVDNQFIMEAEPMKKTNKMSNWMKLTSVAACFALVALIGFGAFQSGLFGPKTDTVTLDNGESICFLKSNGESMTQNDADIKWVSTRALTDDELNSLFYGIPVKGYGYFDTNGQAIAFEGNADGVKMVVSTSQANPMDTVIDGNEYTSTIGGIDVNAGYFVTKANSKGARRAIYYASFEIGDNSVYVEYSGAESERDAVKNALADTIYKLIENGELDLTQIKG